jgi:hypothetical protein
MASTAHGIETMLGVIAVPRLAAALSVVDLRNRVGCLQLPV